MATQEEKRVQAQTRLEIIRSNGEIGYLVDKLQSDFLNLSWSLKSEAVSGTRKSIENMDETLNSILDLAEELEECFEDGAH